MKNFNSLGLKIEDDKIFILDQQLLPLQEKWIECVRVDDMIEAIKALKIRGAPLIAMGAVAILQKLKEGGASDGGLEEAGNKLIASRPTAVNVTNCVKRFLKGVAAEEMLHEDVELCEKMAIAGSELISDGDQILTICNTGGLATVGVGTALGVIKKAHSQKKKIHVYACETRPLLQGGRLTTWELKKSEISHQLICDSMSASLMRQQKITKVFVGADRITKNGDVANKIGTYSLAVLAKHHAIPFYVVAPTTTLDSALISGNDIEIEQRNAKEVRGFGSLEWAPKSTPVYNPAFDVTPAELITGYVLDDQVKDSL